MARSSRKILLGVFAVALAAVAWVAVYRLALFQSGTAFLTTGKKEVSVDIEPATEKKVAVELFFSSADGSGMVPERRIIPWPDDILERCKTVIGEQQRGSLKGLPSLLPREMKVRALFLEEDFLVVDLQPEVTRVKTGTLQETLMWYSLVNAIIINVHEVSAIRFLVDGQEHHSAMGHLNTGSPFKERLELVRWY